MSLRDTLQKAVQPVTTFVARELGDKLSVGRATAARQRDNSTRTTWNAVPGLIHVQGVVEDVAATRAQREFGDDTIATGLITIPTTVEILQDDVIAVESGHFAGKVYNVDERRYDQFTNQFILGVREVPVVAITGT